jgi:hypothetical protein
MALFLEGFRTVTAHIQIVTNQKTLIAHHSLADGAVVHVLRADTKGGLPGYPKLLFIEYVVDSLLCLRDGSDTGF